MAPPNDRTVSYVICALNEEEHIEALIDGIARQDHRPIEVLVVDGGSLDRTRELVRARARALAAPDFSVRLLHEEDYGSMRSAGNARNIGVREAQGDKILLFDADYALIDPAFTSIVARELDVNDSTSVKVRFFEDTPLERFLAGRLPAFAAPGFRRSVFERALFDPTLGYGEDEHWWRSAGVDIYRVGDALLGRHAPHDWAEQYAQERWYGRTLPPFLARMKTDFPQDFWSNTFRRHFINRVPRALFYIGAPVLALALLFFQPLASAALLGLYVLLVLKNFLQEPAGRRDFWSFRMFVPHLLVSSAGFTVGFVQGMIQRIVGRARISRD